MDRREEHVGAAGAEVVEDRAALVRPYVSVESQARDAVCVEHGLREVGHALVEGPEDDGLAARHGLADGADGGDELRARAEAAVDLRAVERAVAHLRAAQEVAAARAARARRELRGAAPVDHVAR